MSQVTVATHPETGNVITPSTQTPGYGTIRVDSIHKSLENNFVNIQKRSAFIRGKIEDLEGLNLREGQALPGKIVKFESYEPFFEGQNPKQYPEGAVVNGQQVGGQSVLKNGRETYLQYKYTEDTNATPDVWVGETAVQAEEATQEAMAEQAI